jgi:hypothetical protein
MINGIKRKESENKKISKKRKMVQKEFKISWI